jgi:hypothetical protein
MTVKRTIQIPPNSQVLLVTEELSLSAMASACDQVGTKRKYASNKIKYHEKVDGRSTVVTFNPTVASKFFHVKDALALTRGKAVSGSDTVGWLIDQSKQGLGSMERSNAKQPVEEASTPAPRRSRRICGEGLPSPTFTALLSGISPSHVLPALRKNEGTKYDEELGFMDLNNEPDNLQTISEEIPSVRSVKKKEEPKVFLAETAKLLKFVKLFPHVCDARDCGERMKAERVGHTHMTATLYLKCSSGHKSF